MKKYIITTILAVLMTAGATLTARSYPDDYLGLPGDNLNLYAVMNLFQESQTLEEFERKLNDPDLRVNNLDLDGDNYVDYITVHDYVDGNVHNIVLRVALNRYETQDVAVFIVQRFSDGSVNIQLVGDEALYGRNYIIEPDYDNYYSGRYNPGYTGGRRVTIRLVADWPVVRFIYLSSYIPWHSTWYWGYYPSYWSPWRPYYYHYYYGFHYYNIHNHYCVMFRRWDRIRYYRYNDFYYSRIRSHSTMYSRREKEGRYRDTYSRPDMRRMGESHYASLSQTRRGDYRASSSDATKRLINYKQTGYYFSPDCTEAGNNSETCNCSKTGNDSETHNSSEISPGQFRFQVADHPETRNNSKTGNRTKISSG